MLSFESIESVKKFERKQLKDAVSKFISMFCRFFIFTAPCWLFLSCAGISGKGVELQLIDKTYNVATSLKFGELLIPKS